MEVVMRQSEIDLFESLCESLLTSATVHGFCRALVHSAAHQAAIQGCHFFSLDADLNLSHFAGYGVRSQAGKDVISVWEESTLTEAVRLKKPVSNLTSLKGPLNVNVPLLVGGIPVGCLELILSQGSARPPFSEHLLPIIGKLATIALRTLKQAVNDAAPDKKFNGQDLTKRQIKILELMADSLTNAEIASKLMVSESTVRQETVRIFKSLGVPNRAAASRKAADLGLIPTKD